MRALNVILMVAAFAGAARASNIVYNNFQASPTPYNNSFSAPLFNTTRAFRWTPNILDPGYISRIDMAIGVSQAVFPPNYAILGVYLDDNNKPGQLLEQITFDVGDFVFPSTYGQIRSAYSKEMPKINSGQNYWVTLTEVDYANHPLNWLYSYGPNTLNLVWFGGAWVPLDPQPLFGLTLRVVTEANAPEPGTLGLFGVALLAIGLVRRRRIV